VFVGADLFALLEQAAAASAALISSATTGARRDIMSFTVDRIRATF
jgi:hypothetical protein